MSKRLKVLVPTMIVVVMLAVIVFTVPAVAQAIQRWFGYVPGFGLVENNDVRSLAAPVQVTQEGITLTVTELTASSTKTVVKYTLENIPQEAFDDKFSCHNPDQMPSLLLSDGSKPDLQIEGWDYGGGKINYDVTFAGIPGDANELTLSFNCVSQTRPEMIPWEWTISLQLDSAPQTAVTIAPIYEVPPTTEQSPQPETNDQPVNQARLQVKQIIELENGYILSGSMTVDPVEGLTVDETGGYIEEIAILDASGKALTPSMAPDDFIIEGVGYPSNQFNWAVQITEKDVTWPLTITINSVTAMTEPYTPGSFMIDVGQDPQADQVWMVNQDVAVGPKMVHVVSLRRLIDTYGLDGYELALTNDPALNLNFEIENCDPNGGGGSGDTEAGETFSLVRGCQNVPPGELKVILNGYGVVQIQGPWQVTVDEPVMP